MEASGANEAQAESRESWRRCVNRRDNTSVFECRREGNWVRMREVDGVQTWPVAADTFDSLYREVK